MFEIITEYTKDVFFKCYKVYYRFLNKHNKNLTILLTITCFVLVTIAIVLGIINPKTIRNVFTSVFFYIMVIIGILCSYKKSDKRIKITVDKIFRKNSNMNWTAKYILNEDRFLSIHGENNITNCEYADIRYFEIVDEYIIVLLKNKKFLALHTKDEMIIEFLKSKTSESYFGKN